MAAKNLKSLNFSLGLNTKVFDTKLKRTERNLKKFGKNLEGIGRNLSIGLTAPLALFGKSAIEAASDLAETQSKFNTVFKSLTNDVRKFAGETAAALGRGQGDIERFLSGFQDILVPMGASREEGAKLSKQLTTLSIDLASFNNETDQEAFTALKSAITGSHETVKRYGVLINQASLNQELLNMGVVGGVKAANEMQKAQARLNIIMASTTDAQGDAAKTSGSYANQVKRLQARIGDLQENLGQVLLPLASKVVTAFTKLTNKFNSLSKESQTTAVKIGLIAAALGPLALVSAQVVKRGAALITFFRTLSASTVAATAQIIAITASVAALVLLGKSFYDTWNYALLLFDKALLETQLQIKKWEGSIRASLQSVINSINALGFIEVPDLFDVNQQEEHFKQIKSLMEQLEAYENITLSGFGDEMGKNMKDNIEKIKKLLLSLFKFDFLGGGGGAPTGKDKLGPSVANGGFLLMDPNKLLKPAEDSDLMPKLKKGVEDLEVRALNAADAFRFLGDTITDSLTNAFSDALFGLKRFDDSVRDLLKNLGKLLLNTAFRALLSSAFGGGGFGASFLSGIRGFATGGIHNGGMALVGEKGPELVNMGASRVFNSEDTMKMLGGSNTPQKLVIDVKDIVIGKEDLRITLQEANEDFNEIFG